MESHSLLHCKQQVTVPEGGVQFLQWKWPHEVNSELASDQNWIKVIFLCLLVAYRYHCYSYYKMVEIAPCVVNIKLTNCDLCTVRFFNYEKKMFYFQRKKK